MASTYSFAVQSRTVFGKKNTELRNQQFVPGVVYGQKNKNVNIAISARGFKKLFNDAGESSLIDLVIDDQKPVTVLIQDIQREPVTGEFVHVDFFRVNMDKKLTATTSLIFEGESMAVKEHGGVLVKSLDHVTVECLPQDLVHEIKVDLSVLENIDDAIYVSDIKTPEGVEIVGDAGTVVILVQPPRKEEEVAVVAETEEDGVESVEVEKKGKAEEGEDGPDEKKEVSGSAQGENKKADDKDKKEDGKKDKK